MILIMPIFYGYCMFCTTYYEMHNKDLRQYSSLFQLSSTYQSEHLEHTIIPFQDAFVDLINTNKGWMDH